MAKMNYEYIGFAIAREIIHDHKFSFYTIHVFLLEHNDLTSCKYFVTFYDDFEITVFFWL